MRSGSDDRGSPERPATESPGRLLAVATAVLLTLIWGTTWAAIRISLEGFAPLTGLALRLALGSGILLLAAWVGKVRLGRTRHEIPLWLVQCVFAFGLAYALVYWAEQWVPSGLTAVLFATLPFFVALFAYFLVPEERLGVLGLCGMVVGFAGVAVIFSEDLDRLAGAEVRQAALVLLIGPASIAFSEVAVKRWGHEVHALSLTAVPMAMSSVLLGALAAAFERHRPIVPAPAPVAAVLYLAVFGSAVAFSLFFWLLKHVTVTQLSLTAFGIPVVAVVVGTVFLDEPFTPRMAAGAALVMRRSAPPPET